MYNANITGDANSVLDLVGSPEIVERRVAAAAARGDFGRMVATLADGETMPRCPTPTPPRIPGSLERMGVPVTRTVNVGAFTERQSVFLEYHRDAVFLMRASSLRA